MGCLLVQCQQTFQEKNPETKSPPLRTISSSISFHRANSILRNSGEMGGMRGIGGMGGMRGIGGMGGMGGMAGIGGMGGMGGIGGMKLDFL